MLAWSEISIFYLVSVAEETGLGLTLSETPKTGFIVTRPICGLLTSIFSTSVHLPICQIVSCQSR